MALSVNESTAVTSSASLSLGVLAPAYNSAKAAEHRAFVAWQTGVTTVASDYTAWQTALTNYINNATTGNKASVTSAFNTWQSAITSAATLEAAWQAATDQIWLILSAADLVNEDNE